MSFFNPIKPRAVSPPPGMRKPGVQRGDRMLAVRVEEPEVPEFRKPGVTLESYRGGKPPKVGRTNAVVLERLPRGCLFKVAGGWFDLDGYWCVPKGDKRVEVRRGSSKAVLRLLSAAQRHELARVRLNARRRGVR